MTDLCSSRVLASASPSPVVPDTAEDTIALLLLLAGLFAAPPEEGTMVSLRRGAGADLLTRLAGHASLAEPIAAFRETIDGEDGEAEFVRRLAPVFALLFLGLGGPSTVAPYESVHRCGGRLWQAPTGEMERLLARHDLSPALDHEPADHLSIETALLVYLVATGRSDRHAVAARLRGWVPDFAEALAHADGTGVFAAAAALLAAAIDLASDLPDEPRTA